MSALLLPISARSLARQNGPCFGLSVNPGASADTPPEAQQPIAEKGLTPQRTPRLYKIMGGLVTGLVFLAGGLAVQGARLMMTSPSSKFQPIAQAVDNRFLELASLDTTVSKMAASTHSLAEKARLLAEENHLLEVHFYQATDDILPKLGVTHQAWQQAKEIAAQFTPAEIQATDHLLHSSASFQKVFPQWVQTVLAKHLSPAETQALLNPPAAFYQHLQAENTHHQAQLNHSLTLSTEGMGAILLAMVLDFTRVVFLRKSKAATRPLTLNLTLHNGNRVLYSLE